MSNTDSAAVTAVAKAQKAAFGAEVVTRTLDNVNRYKARNKKNQSDMSASYDFQKSVLSAVYEPKGTIARVKS